MLNYIWAGLIIFSLVFALATDTHELATDRFRNEAPLPITLNFPDGYTPDARRQTVRVRIDSAAYQQFYDVDTVPDSAYAGTLLQTRDGRQVQFGGDGTLPEPLNTVRSFLTSDDGDPLRGTTRSFPALAAGASSASAAVQFEPVRFRKLNDIADAALSFAETAAELSLGLIGTLALVLGLLQIGDAAGLIHALSRFVQPVLRPLFPELPKDHPALATITLNLLANVFGLGNAATPLGIKAMEDLQKENPSDHTATNSMVMLLALNTSSVQLVPPVLLIAIMGLQINQLVFSITLATFFSTIAGITAAIGLSKLKRFRATNPMRTTD
jgi:spore maturation protein A